MDRLDALACFPETERHRIDNTLNHLLPYLVTNEFAIVGGLAIRYFAAANRQMYPPREFNDLDIIIKRRESIDPSISEAFNIAHFHDTAIGPYFALIDPETKIKIDAFPWPACEPTRTYVHCSNNLLPFQSVEDQLAKTILDTTTVLNGGVVDPKQFSDAELLTHIADGAKTSQIFAVLYGDREPTVASAQEALALAQRAREVHPELAKTKPFVKSQPYTCTECTIDPAYPLTPLKKIYDLLGYVE